MLSGLPDAWTTPNEGGESWSAYDIVGHLIQGERVDWIGRSRLILEQGENRKFIPFDRTAMFRDSVGKSLANLLDEFERLRADNLATVAGWKLTESELALEGEH